MRCRICHHNLMGIIERFPHFMYDITANLGERVREFSDTLKNIALERVESRIAALLIKLAEKTGEKAAAGAIEITMRLTKQDIAEMVGTTVETSIRVMSRFRKVGISKGCRRQDRNHGPRSPEVDSEPGIGERNHRFYR